MFESKKTKITRANQVKRLNEQEETIESLRADVNMMATSIDSVNFLLSSDAVNPNYKTREAQIANCIEKYKGLSIRSNYVLQRCINLRVAFSIPNRLFLIKNPTKKYSDSEINETKEFLNNFMGLNHLDSYLPRDLAKESELQGQVAVGITWDNKENLPKISYFPYNTTGYTIKKQERYNINSKLMLDMSEMKGSSEIVFDKSQNGKVLNDDDFVFIAFNDMLGDPLGYPTCGPILRVIDNLESDLEDWRSLNHLFAHPTPVFSAETKEEADAIKASIVANGWKVGTAIAINGDFKLVGPSGTEANMLLLSIQTNAKMLSGHTGIGIHFLGFANVMSNRSTADSMGEPTEVVLHSEITSWRGFYFDLFKKAIRLRNKKLNKELPEDAIMPWLVPLTDRQWSVIKDVMMPLNAAGTMSTSTLLSNIPGIDADEEMEKIKKEEKEFENKKPKTNGLDEEKVEDDGEDLEGEGGNEPDPRVPGKNKV